MNTNRATREANPKAAKQPSKLLPRPNMSAESLVNEFAQGLPAVQPADVLVTPGDFRSWYASDLPVPDGLATDELKEWGGQIRVHRDGIMRRERELDRDKKRNDERLYAWIVACKERGWTYERMAGACGFARTTLEKNFSVIGSTELSVRKLGGDAIPLYKRELVTKYAPEHQEKLLPLIRDRQINRENALDIIQAYCLDNGLTYDGPQWSEGSGLSNSPVDDGQAIPPAGVASPGQPEGQVEPFMPFVLKVNFESLEDLQDTQSMIEQCVTEKRKNQPNDATIHPWSVVKIAVGQYLRNQVLRKR